MNTDLKKTTRNTSIIITNDFIATIGNSIFSILMMWYIFEITESAIYMALVGSFIHITTFFIGPIAGVIVDRSNKPIRILATALLCNGFLLLLMALGIWRTSGAIEILLILALLFLRDSAYAFTHPSETKIIPNIVEEKCLSVVFGYRSSSSQIGSLIGNALSGFILVLFGIIGAVIINSLTFFISSFILSLITPLKNFSGSESTVVKKKDFFIDRNFFVEIIDSIKIIKSHESLRKIVIISILINVSSMIGPLYVVFVNQQLNAGPEVFGLLHVAGLIGGVIGGLSIGILNKAIRSHWLIVYTLLTSGFLITIFSFVSNYLIALPIFLLFTFSMTIANISLGTLLIINIPEQYRGRVSSTLMALNVMFIPLFNIIGGAIAEFISVGAVYFLAGIWVILVSLLCVRNINIIKKTSIRETL